MFIRSGGMISPGHGFAPVKCASLLSAQISRGEEFVGQNFKNVVKKWMVRMDSSGILDD